jgi:hypothetical protein
VLAGAGVTEQSAPWLWQGLPIAWQASQDLVPTQSEHLPKLSTAFAAGESPPAASGSWAAVEYLIQELGWEGLGRFIHDFGQACANERCSTAAGVDRAMISALQMDLDAFNAAWLGHWRSRLDEVQADLDRLLLNRVQALQQGAKEPFLATVNAADPYLLSSESAWFDRQAGAAVSNLTMAAQPIALFANGDVLTSVTFEYQTGEQDGQPQLEQAMMEILFAAAGGGYQWAGLANQTLAGDSVTIRYPEGRLDLAQLLLSEAEDIYARLAGMLQEPERQPVILELYPDRDSFRFAIGLGRLTAGWLPAWSAPGSNVVLQRQADDSAASYRPALAYQLARQLLYQKGIEDEWLLKGLGSQLSITMGDRETRRALTATLGELLASETGYDQADLSAVPADESLSNPAWLTQTAFAWDSLNHLLAREGWSVILAFLDQTGETGDLPASFAEVFGQSLADFQGEWLAFAATGYAAPQWVEAVNELDAEITLEHVDFLGSDLLAGRQAGTPGAEIAADYIARRFAEYGLQQAGDLYPGSYFQSFPITITERVSEPVLQILDDPAPYHFRENFLSLYSTLDAAPIEGELVWLDGPGEQDLDFGGKIALAMANDDAGALLESALAKNAAGLLLLGFKNEPTELYAKRPLGPSILADIPVLELTQEGTLRLLELLDLDFDEIRALPAGAPLAVQARLASAIATKEQVMTTNVLGLLPGSDPLLGQQVIVIGAHYDHVGDDPPGACQNQDDCRPGIRYSGLNDNASGVATLLEIARLWQQIGYRPKHSVLFAAWGAQEAGQLGSSHYVREPILPLTSIVAVLQLDGLGGGDGFYPGLNARPEIDGYLIQYVTAAAGQLEQKIVHVPSPLENDQLSFAAQGIPAGLFSWRLADENNLPDEWANGVSPERLAASGRVVALALMMMAR